MCSTTGNGDSPENADGFWRWIKARALPKDLCEGLPFSVLGLGDTNYDKFCFMGKSIDKRLNELGGKRIVDLHCADEPTNLEEVVEAWKTKIVAAVKRISASVICGEDTISNVTSDVDCLNLESIKITEDNDAICAIPEGVMSASDVWAALALEGDMCAPPLAKHLPGGAAGAVDHVEILSSSVVPQNTEHVSEMTNTINNSDVGATVAEWTVDKPFISEVVSARYLTDGSTFDDNSVEQPPWGEEKKVVEAILSLSASGISYEPGDSVAICCPNPEYIVNIVLNRLNLSMSDHSPKLTKETLVRVKNCNPCTLGELLSFK